MADLEDLGYKSILNMDNDEAIETLRQIRLSRRVPVKTKKASTKKDVKVSVDAATAAKLLEILGGSE